MRRLALILSKLVAAVLSLSLFESTDETLPINIHLPFVSYLPLHFLQCTYIPDNVRQLLVLPFRSSALPLAAFAH